MDGISSQLEALWDDLLSREPERIREVFISLDPPNQKIILAHLKNMVEESGWQPEQRLSAKTALQALKEYVDLDN